MNKFKIKLIVLILFIFFNKIHSIIYNIPQRAICIAPVVDLLNNSVQLTKPNEDTKNIYSKIPYSPENESNELAYLTCLRVHQALFNEEVEIIEELDHEIKIIINTAFYYISRNNFKKNSYWALKSNFKKLNECAESKIDLSKVPQTIDCNKTDYDELPKQKTIIIKLPFFDIVTNKIYSVGTRFVYKDADENSYTIFIYDPKNNKIIETKISKKICSEFQKASNPQKIKDFVNLLKLWTYVNKKPIPYVWGGSSMQQLSNYDNKLRLPYSGFDCSGLILRAAQICRIPYFFKDCLTINKHLNALTKEDKIQEGDLIWFCGHIIIISDTQKNLCIEARGYCSGHGILHEIALGKIFKGINTFEQLKEHHLNESTIELINKAGKVSRVLNKFRILKLNSVFKYGN